MATKLKLTVLAADVISQGWERFVFDYSTLKFPERAALDYIHDDGEIIGYVENFKATPEAVTADATLLDESPNGRAAEIAFNLDAGVPYEASAFLDLEGTTETEVKEGAVENVNGRELHGPFTLYRGATLRGVAVCPHGADAKTRTSLALSTSTKGKLMALKTELNGDAVKLSAEVADAGATSDSVEQTEPTAAIDPVPELEDAVKLSENCQSDDVVKLTRQPRKIDEPFDALVQEFGLERGVEYYREGFSLDEARLDDYAKLKAAKKDDSELVALRSEIQELKKKLEQFSVVKRGDDKGVSFSATNADIKKPTDPVAAMAEKFAREGTKKIC